MFPWTHRMQFWHSCRKVFAKGLKTVLPMSIGKEGNFQKTKKYSKSSLQTPKMLFWKPYLKRFNRKPNSFQKIIFWKNWRFLEKTIFISEGSIGHVECSFDHPAWFFLAKGRKLVSQAPENIKKTKVSSRLPYVKEKTVSTTRRETIWQKLESFLPSDWIIKIFETISRKKKKIIPDFVSMDT